VTRKKIYSGGQYVYGNTRIAIYILPPTVFVFASHELYESHIICDTTHTEGADIVCPYPLNEEGVQYPHDDIGCRIEGADIPCPISSQQHRVSNIPSTT